jgi:MFS family permease
MQAFSIFKIKSFRYFFWGRFFLFLGIHAQMNTISLQVYYQYTRDEFMLGLVGLCEAIPFMVSALYMGYLADRRNKKHLLQAGLILLTLLMMYYVLFSALNKENKSHAIWIYAGVVIFGFIRALLAASLQSILPQIIDSVWYEKASAWNSSAWQISTIFGPLISTFLFIGNHDVFHPSRVYALVGVCYIMSVYFFSQLSYRYQPLSHKGNGGAWDDIKAGIRFVRHEKFILSALLLDMLAVLFGGVSAIIPAFVDKELKLSPDAVAYLRMAPAFGALSMAFLQTRWSVMEKAGRYLIYSVAAYGLFTLGFALSPGLVWAFVFLFLTGAADNISIVIRHTMLQLMTPDSMRGKVSAINSIFIGSSNEIGAFESGAAARIMGIRPSVIFGAAMTMISVVFMSMKFKGLYQLNLKKWLAR